MAMPPPGPFAAPHPLLTRVMQSEALLRTVAVVIIGAGAAYLLWLLTQGLDWSLWWLAVPVAIANIQAYLSVLLFIFTVWYHDRPSREPSLPGRSVDIFIATLNESYAVLAPTIIGASRVTYPHTTYVLDDGNRPWVEELCREHGAVWVTRDDGRRGKGWNLRHGMEVSQGEFIVTLDADFVPAPWIIDHLIGFFADEVVALVQGPQVYYNTNSFQHARESDTWNEQTMFYEVSQPGKNHWNAAFWTGTPAMLRRSALDSIGGIVAASLTEDIATTLRLHQAGFRSVYFPGMVAAGLAPEDYSRFFNQRLRWTRGGIQTFRDGLIRRGGLTRGQFLSYVATMARPWDALRQTTLYLLPPIFMLTRQIPIQPSPGYFGLFLAAHVTILFGSVLLSRGTLRIVRAFVYDILWIAAALIAWRALFERSPEFRVTAKGRSGLGRGSTRPVLWVVGLALVYCFSLPFGIAWAMQTDELRAEAVTVWSAAMTALLLGCAAFALTHGRDAWGGVVTSAEATVVSGGLQAQGVVTRLAVDRLLVRTNEPLARGAEVEVRLAQPAAALAGVAGRSARKGDAWETRIELSGSAELARAVVASLFEPEAWPTKTAPVAESAR